MNHLGTVLGYLRQGKKEMDVRQQMKGSDYEAGKTDKVLVQSDSIRLAPIRKQRKDGAKKWGKEKQVRT